MESPATKRYGLRRQPKDVTPTTGYTLSSLLQSLDSEWLETEELVVFKKILVAIDGSAGSWRALRAAIGIAKEYNSELWGLSVVDRLPHLAFTIGEVEDAMDRRGGYLRKIQSQAADVAEAHGVELHLDMVPGHAAPTIVEYASQGGFDLIVMGHKGHSGIWGMLLGSVSDKVSRHAH